MRPIYLDYHATTPVLPQVLEAMGPYFSEDFGNANSSHQWGLRANQALHQASQQVADLVGAQTNQVYYTSGATESLCWGITGWTRQRLYLLDQPKLITTTTEHKATYGACEFAQELGAEIKRLGVDGYGRLNLEELRRELQEECPTLLSVIHGNNEIGTLNPLEEISELKKEFPHFFIHVDGAQSVGKCPLDFKKLDLDFLCFSGHKLYGPKGIGVLVVKDKTSLAPLFGGGGQQRGMRAGTLNVPSIVGLGVACQWVMEHMQGESQKFQALRERMTSQLLATGEVILNGHPTERLPHNMSFTFKNISLDRLLSTLPQVGLSSSSACSGGEGSHVLQAIGRTDEEARQTIRLGMGYGTTAQEIEYVTEKILALHFFTKFVRMTG